MRNGSDNVASAIRTLRRRLRGQPVTPMRHRLCQAAVAVVAWRTEQRTPGGHGEVRQEVIVKSAAGWRWSDGRLTPGCSDVGGDGNSASALVKSPKEIQTDRDVARNPATSDEGRCVSHQSGHGIALR